MLSVSPSVERWHTARCEAHLSLTFTFLLLFSHTDVGLRAGERASVQSHRVGENPLPGHGGQVVTSFTPLAAQSYKWIILTVALKLNVTVKIRFSSLKSLKK